MTRTCQGCGLSDRLAFVRRMVVVEGIPDPAVARLRLRLERLDATLVRNLRERERVQARLLATKEVRGLQLTDPEQEDRVRRRARLWARELGGDPELAESVIFAAIVSGKRRFESARRRAAIVAAQDPALSPESGFSGRPGVRRSRVRLSGDPVPS